ncbi:MAG: RNA 2'-phosphotransferase [Acidobacteriota bacterium]
MGREPRLIAASKLLAYLLRHDPHAIGLALSPEGWADIDDLCCRALMVTRSIATSCSTSSRGNPKRRFEVDGERRRVRAQQGHSVAVDLGLAPREPPPILYHGTVERFLPAILRDGLSRRSRRHVHLSAEQDTALAVGARRGTPVVLSIDAGRMHAGGHTFFLSGNGVWLTEHVPPEFVSVPSPPRPPVTERRKRRA